MDLVYCRCKSCGGRLGDFINLWTQIGKSYFAPLVEPRAELNVKLQGNVRVGEKNTLVEACDLQDIVCAGCDEIVGLKCLNTPVNHVLDKNQILLRISSINTVNRNNRATVELVIKRHLSLKDVPGKPSPAPNDAPRGRGTQQPGPSFSRQSPRGSESSDPDILQIQADVDGARDDIDRIENTGFQIFSAIDKAVQRMEQEVKDLKDTARDLRRDLGGNQDDLSSLKSELKGVKATAQDRSSLESIESRLQGTIESVYGIKQDLTSKFSQILEDLSGIKSDFKRQQAEIEKLRSAAAESSATAKSHAKELSTLRADVARLRRQIDQDRTTAPETAPAVFPSRELDILTSNIAKIGNRASLVESLQMEFEMLKGRVERMEATADSRKAPDNAVPHGRKSTRAQQPKDPYDVPDDDVLGGSGRRKRLSPDVEAVSNDDTPSKRLAFSSDYAETPTRNHDASLQWPPTSPEVARRRSGLPKLTKSGSIDKRTLKRSSRRSNG
ncbi:uncharacterized protein E0L32_009716 [Thyridium curvatum]|uniref:Yippee/Mis18/Cereblon domain-containing protein n=1 Tax=Thyridium curvatum TaxID=1093900 RepID=A0A507APW4_9PEZI|nr:uncharacterized protein E0L32_009716 [Thyridium curvatum]TPX08776.1 hypothetical protein E0L32_009716 [Thyridium curvatum]